MKNRGTYGIVKNIWFGLQTCFRASKKYFILKCVVLLSTTLLPLINIWLWKEILNFCMVADADRKKALVYLAFYLLVVLIVHLFSKTNTYINERYSDELQFYIEKVMIDKMSRMDLAFYDSASMGDKITRARSNFGIMTEIAWIVFSMISEFVNILISLIVVCTYKAWIGVLVFVTLVPYMIYNRVFFEKKLRFEKEQIRDNRKKDFFESAIYDDEIQFEIKLNKVGIYLLEQYKTIWNTLFHKKHNFDVKHTVIDTFLIICNMVSEAAVIVISIIDVTYKKIGIGDFQYNLSLVTRLREQACMLTNDINRFLENNEKLFELQEFMAIEPKIEKSGYKIPSAQPEIEFRDVSYTYFNGKSPVLKHCSFIIRSGEKVGFVGLNGAGKSTIVKLLFRFYDPDEGDILIDGQDIKEYNVYALRKIFSVLFQDYVTYCLPLREIIALSAFDEKDNDKKLLDATNLSGITEVIKDWKKGFDTVIGRFYADDGKDFSGGQWQKVGLSRAYFHEAENYIFDEPSAALDPIAEYNIFRQMYELSMGKGAVIISHRLSNIMLADRIFVVDDGHIVEQGTHDELMEMKGEYERLFTIQAKRYI